MDGGGSESEAPAWWPALAATPTGPRPPASPHARHGPAGTARQRTAGGLAGHSHGTVEAAHRGGGGALHVVVEDALQIRGREEEEAGRMLGG